NRNDRLPLRVAMLLSLEHHPNSPIPQLHRILPRPLLGCHDSILSRSGACALLGEVQGVVAVRAGAGAIAGVLGPAVVFLILGGMFGVSLIQMLRVPGQRERVPA